MKRTVNAALEMVHLFISKMLEGDADPRFSSHSDTNKTTDTGLRRAVCLTYRETAERSEK